MIKTMISETGLNVNELPADVEAVKHHPYPDRTFYLQTTHVGMVLAVGEKNGRDDSDFWALVWNAEKQEPEHITYATTRGWTYLNSATVDATPETLEAYRGWQQRQREAQEQRKAAYEARMPSKGKRVKVVAGRKLALGLEGEVFWFGEAREFGACPRGGYKEHAKQMAAYARSLGILGDPRTGMRVGVMIDGKKVFTAATNVEVVSC